MLLEVKNLNIHFQTKRGKIHAVRDVNFTVNEEETLGVVGESGCGKSITSLAIMGLLDDNAIISADKLNFNGVDLLNLSEKKWQEIRGKNIGMIFQDPMGSLNPCFTVEYQISEVLKLHEENLTKYEIRNKVIELLNDVGIPSPESRLKSYPHELSGGMAQRIMIAQALACNPKLLIADEPTTALDVTVQQQILELLNELKEKRKMAVIFIGHDLNVIKDVADNLQIMYAGEIVERGVTKEVMEKPSHPYSRGLLKSIPSLSNTHSDLYSIPGMVPALNARPSGCQFAPRCYKKNVKCDEKSPGINLGEAREIRCYYPEMESSL